MAPARFQLQADARAREWMERHPATRPHAIVYETHRCCGGGKICQVNVRELSAKDRLEDFATGVLDDGTELLIDRKAAARLPPRFGLTVRGLGPLKHLDLDLEAEQWGTLLYD
jgi:hypothetical protein